MAGVGFGPPQRSRSGRTGAVSMEMLQSWLAKLGAGVLVELDTDQATVSGVELTIDWDLATSDTHGFWTATDPDVLTVPKGLDGVYIAGGVVAFQSDGTGSRRATLDALGVAGIPISTEKRQVTVAAVSGVRTDVPVPSPRLYLSAGDQVSIGARQNSTSALDLQGNQNTWFSLTRVGDLPREARVL